MQSNDVMMVSLSTIKQFLRPTLSIGALERRKKFVNILNLSYETQVKKLLLLGTSLVGENSEVSRTIIRENEEISS